MVLFTRARGRNVDIASIQDEGSARRDAGRGLDSKNRGVADELRRAREGDPEIWRQWYATYYSSLYRYAYIRLRQREEAEDIAAQVFLEAVRGIDRYRGSGAILAWLYGIEKNLIFDRLKARYRRPDEGVDGLLSPTDVDNSLEAKSNSLDLFRALESLTDQQRDAVILRYFVGLSTKEISDLLGKSPTAVFSVEARALVALRKQLGEGFHP